MPPLLYRDLVSWYRLLDALEDHEDEAALYQRLLERAATPEPHTLLELGSGAGNNAYYLKDRFRCTLADLSEAMLDLSRPINPECEHVVGDMRALRLGREFDVVFVHDAIGYMASEADLRAAAETAFVHTRRGGGALFAPDDVRETFRESTELHQDDDDDGVRSLRCIEWSWDPDPSDDTHVVEYAFLLRNGTEVSAVHDRHVAGLFARDTWLRILREVGYQPERVELVLDGMLLDAFLCRRP